MRNHTKIVIILDRSGSMVSMRSDMEPAINNFIHQQKLIPGGADFTLVQFDDIYEVVYKNLAIACVPYISIEPRGGTALFDAIGKTINAVGEELASLSEKDRPNKVVFVIITDGMENSSREFSRDQIFEMITHQSNKYNWQFTYLGANQDALGVAHDLGILSSSNYSDKNIMRTMDVFSCSVSSYRTGEAQNVIMTDQGTV